MNSVEVPPGVRLALDWGEARIGVAACDRDGMLAFPVETVAAGKQALSRLQALADEYEPAAVVVGLPRSLSGREGPAAAKIRHYAEQFAALVDVPVVLIDERFTTVVAAGQLHAAGRSAKKQRAVIDQAAAVAILNSVLESERRGASVSGALLSGSTPTPGTKEHA